MRTKQITRCRSCSSHEISFIYSLGDFALSEFVEKYSEKQKKYPLTLMLCSSCSLLQLQDTVPTSLLYTENYGYRSGINKTMRNELKEIVKQTLSILKTAKKDLLAIDIGANDGTLLSFYPKTITRVAIEPVTKLATTAKTHADVVINDFFNFKSYFKSLKNKKANIITVISCFYDMEKPNTFLLDITKILAPDGLLVIQQNYLVSMLTQNAFDNIVHEHLEYYSLHSLQHLLQRHNLEVFHIEENNLNGGSFRTYICYEGQRPIDASVTTMMQREKKLKLHTKKIYLDFIKRVQNNKNDLLKFIHKEIKQGKTVSVYGASTRGNTLLQHFGLDYHTITNAVERNPEKWGKIIASVGIPIISEQLARKQMPDYLLVLPWFFKDEFLQREKKYLENGGKIIFPLPKIEIF